MKRESKKKRNCSSSTCNCLQITDLHCWNGTTRDKQQAVIQWPLYGEYNHNRKNVSLPLFHRRAAHITLSSPSLFIWTGDYHKLAICIISTCSGDSTLTHFRERERAMGDAHKWGSVKVTMKSKLKNLTSLWNTAVIRNDLSTQLNSCALITFNQKHFFHFTSPTTSLLWWRLHRFEGRTKIPPFQQPVTHMRS